MAEAFLQIVLENLNSLIKGEIDLIKGVDEEMNNLFSTLTTIQSVLEDAEMKQLESRPIQNWLIKLNDLTYEIDDILDECATQLSKLEHKNSAKLLEAGWQSYYLSSGESGEPMDAKKSNLTEKENLRHLCLEWKASKSSGGEESDEKVLEALKPHPNVENLEIKAFTGRCFPVWMSNSTMDKVVRICISDCDNCLHLPQLGELPHLKYLSLDNVARVEYTLEDQSGNSSTSIRQFPSLETLYLWHLPKIKGLLNEQAMMGSVKVEAFQNLEELYILDCNSLNTATTTTLIVS